MVRVCFLFVVAVMLCAPATARSSNENSFPSLAEQSLVNAIYSRGRKQIMEADISPICRQMALNALTESADADSQMKCDTTGEKAEDVAEILLVVWDSLGYFMDDVNTVVNGIPICMGTYGNWNPLKISCIFTHFWPIWNAVKHFYNYSDFWMKPYKVMNEFYSCMRQKQSVSTNNVNMILNNAKFCN